MNKYFKQILLLLMLVISSFSFSAEKRFGNSTVGFIDSPKEYSVFKDPNNKGTALQLEKGKGQGNIITLDFIDIPKDITLTTQQGIDNFKNYWLSLGVAPEAMSVNYDAKIAGNKASQLVVQLPENLLFVVNLIEYKNKMYYVAIEGTQAQELYNLVNKSWNPNK